MPKDLPVLRTSQNQKFRPDFRPEFMPYKVKETFNGEMPKSVPNTFYDLLSPNVSGTSKRQSFTFREIVATFAEVLAKPFIEAGLHRAEQTGRKVKDLKYYMENSGFSRDELLKVYKAEGRMPPLAKYIKTKRVGDHFEIVLPLHYGALFNEFAKTLYPIMGKDYTINDTNSIIDAVEQLKAQHGINLYGNDKEVIFTNLNPKQSPAYNFIKKYVINVGLITEKGLNKPKKVNKPNNVVVDSDGSLIITQDSTPLELDTDVIPDSKNITGFDASDILHATRLIFATIKLPIVETPYYFQKKAQDVTEADVLDYFTRWYTKAFTVNKPIAIFSHPYEKIVTKNNGFIPRPRTDENGIIITANNTPMFVPDHEAVNLISDYGTSYASLIDIDEDTGFHTRNLHDLKSKVGLTNSLLYVDWVNNKLLYTSETPEIKLIDIDRTYKTSAFVYLSTLNAPLHENSDSLLNIVSALSIRNAKLGVSNNLSDYLSQQDEDAIAEQLVAISGGTLSRYSASSLFKTRSLTDYVRKMCDIAEAIRLSTTDIVPLPLRISDITFSSPVKALRPIALWIDATLSKFKASPIYYINNCGYSPKDTMTSIAHLIIIGSSQKIKEIARLDLEERADYINQDDITVPDSIALNNAGGLEKFGYMPHQAKVMAATKTIPRNAIIAVAAGGGKTILTITEIIRALTTDIEKMRKQNIRKCLVLCPNMLVKDYVNEINFVSNGTINPVVLDTEVYGAFTKMQDRNEKDYSVLEKLVNNAPINTIFISGYSAYSRTGNVISSYGGELIEGNTNLDFIRHCKFDGVWMDESHFLKNKTSNVSQSIALLIADIPYKRLLTGTIVPNNMVDLVAQTGLFNPSILGSEKSFMRRFGVGEKTENKANFVMAPGAENDIVNVLKQTVVFQNIQRKEWAAILPRLHEAFIPAYLTTNQAAVYKTLLENFLAELESNDAMKEMIAEDNANAGIDVDDAKLEKMMRSSASLAKIEAFLANPSIIGEPSALPNEEDRVSPKGAAAAEIIEKHLAEPKKYVGKILVFCNTEASRDGVYLVLKQKFGDKVMLYTAKNKTKDKDKFNLDDSVRILVGISTSLEVGVNLQVADTIIRIDTVWSPGTFEQGNSRIVRPTGKKDDPRLKTGVFIYHVFVDGTIDVLKTARLTSKIVQVAKFYNARTDDAQYYENIGLDEDGKPLEAMSISLDNLRNNLTQKDLMPYITAFSEYRSAENYVFNKYKENNPSIGRVQVLDKGVMPDSKLLKRIPYTSGMSLFDEQDLGLVLYITYRRDYEFKHSTEKDPAARKLNPVGLRIHTERGEATCVGYSETTLKLETDQGLKYSVETDKCFVSTKHTTTLKEIRKVLADHAGLPLLNNDIHQNFKLTGGKGLLREAEAERKRKAALERRAQKLQTEAEKRKAKVENRKAKQTVLEQEKLLKSLDKEAKRLNKENERLRLQTTKDRDARIKELEERESKKSNPVNVIKSLGKKKASGIMPAADNELNQSINLFLNLNNEFITLSTSQDDPDVDSLTNFGFVETPAFWFIKVKRVQQLREFIDKLDALNAKEKLLLTDEYYYMLHHLLNEFKKGKSKLLQVSQHTNTEIGFFLRAKKRKLKNPIEVQPSPMIVNGELYICLDTRIHSPAIIALVKRIKVAGATKWELQSPTLSAFFTKKSGVSEKMRQLKESGIIVENKEAVKKSFNQLKLTKKPEEK